MKIKYIFLLLIVSIAGILFYTNPSKPVVDNFIKQKFISVFNDKVSQEISQSNDPKLRLLANLGKNLLPLAGDQWINEKIDSRIRNKNYYLLTVIELNYRDQWNPIGIGIFNRVFLFPKVEEEINNFDFKEEFNKLLH
ncbi:hypothetical protein ETU08_10645 [Apibacter muscae]|uniref:DUF4359 domain-containing protein n=1 Tax=Apibacter muscae TaxID=2509004 RepID=A0A563D8R1_9FLAO|nr:hypothetical protein [Apibacter muscae]TWP26585.1 hypothetical protein ETU09_08465 [Apibacter muscae]TWP28159.1 hypothetical protein ETU08_10645 [Apibacter muscae]